MVQSAVRSGRTEVCFYPLHGRKWLLIDWQGEFLPAQWLGAQKFSLLHLMIAQTPPVLPHCQYLIQETTWESPAAPSTRPPWSHLYTTEGPHPRVPQSPLLVGNAKTIPVYFQYDPVFLFDNSMITLITLYVYNNIIIIFQFKTKVKTRENRSAQSGGNS